jgi:SEC-C motif
MTKVGRNQECPCGSGKKYKRCRGMLDTSSAMEPPPIAEAIPAHILEVVRARERAGQRFHHKHGEGKGIITVEVNGTRFVAAGNSLHYSTGWANFHDFLNGYLAGAFGKEWGERQVKLTIDQQHPVVQWHTYLALGQQGTQPGPDGWYSSTLGAANAWGRLGYDLYLVDHNAELQNRLVRRLRISCKLSRCPFRGRRGRHDGDLWIRPHIHG